MELWGNFKTPIVPAKTEIEKLLPLINYKEIAFRNNNGNEIKFGKSGMELDLSGIVLADVMVYPA